MVTPDRRWAIVYNGEVYNFKELRRELEQRGTRFRSTGDAEVVLHALSVWGKAALNRFNGMFALAIYDAREKRLVLARDHAGIKPLYYLLTSTGIVFASQYDQILAHPWASSLHVSNESLSLYLRLGYIPAPSALLRNTYMLEPGAWLEVTGEGRVERGKFFEFPVFVESDLGGEEACEAIDAAITAAVRRHLVSDVPVGTFLSGGIDSPLVTAKAAAASPSLRAFTVGTDDDLDESADAAAYASELNLAHVVERTRPELALTMLDDVVMACGEPFADYSVFPTMLISRLARRHVKVMLSGDGGDELFWGYPSRFVTPIKYSNDFRQPQWFRKLRWVWWRIMAGSDRRHDLRYSSMGELYRTAHLRIDEATLKRLFPDIQPWPSEFALFEYKGCERDRSAQWLRWNEFVSHLTMVLLKVDRASMYHSLEVRVPLLDREVVELACRIDWRSCLDLKSGVGKLPLRRALARDVSHSTKAKRGFEAPMKTWLKGPLKPLIHDAVIGQQEIMGLRINRTKAESMLKEHNAGIDDHTRSLWTLLSLALWEKKHYRGRMRPQTEDRGPTVRKNEELSAER